MGPNNILPNDSLSVLLDSLTYKKLLLDQDLIYTNEQQNVFNWWDFLKDYLPVQLMGNALSYLLIVTAILAFIYIAYLFLGKHLRLKSLDIKSTNSLFDSFNKDLNYYELVKRYFEEKNSLQFMHYILLDLFKILNDKSMVQIKKYYTIKEVISQIKTAEIKRNMNEIVRSYYYVIYGQFTLSDDDFKTLFNHYISVIERIENV